MDWDMCPQCAFRERSPEGYRGACAQQHVFFERLPKSVTWECAENVASKRCVSLLIGGPPLTALLFGSQSSNAVWVLLWVETESPGLCARPHRTHAAVAFFLGGSCCLLISKIYVLWVTEVFRERRSFLFNKHKCVCDKELYLHFRGQSSRKIIIQVCRTYVTYFQHFRTNYSCVQK